MSHEPLHPIFRLLLGTIDEMQIQFLEGLIGPVRGPRAIFTLLSIGLPFFVAGACVVHFQAYNYAAYFFVLPLLIIFARLVSRFWNS